MDGSSSTLVTVVEIVEGWREGLKYLSTVHLQTGNEMMMVKGDSTHVFCYEIAIHHSLPAKKGTTRRFVGIYDVDLLKEKKEWKISG
jgi:hypothetical protein